MPKTETVKNGDKSFTKLFEIIKLVGSSRNGLTGREIAERTDFPSSTTFRMLKFLVDKGYFRNDGNCYLLGQGFLKLGILAQEQNPLQRLAHPYLVELSEKTFETVHLAVLRGGTVCYFDKVEGQRSVRMGSLIGSTSPVYCTGVGKAILAFLPEEEQNAMLKEITFERFTPHTIQSLPELKKQLKEIKIQGFAVDDCEHELGVYCLAAPIIRAGRVIAGVSISGSELYLKEKRVELSTFIRDAAAKISNAGSGGSFEITSTIRIIE